MLTAAFILVSGSSRGSQATELPPRRGKEGRLGSGWLGKGLPSGRPALPGTQGRWDPWVLGTLGGQWGQAVSPGAGFPSWLGTHLRALPPLYQAQASFSVQSPLALPGHQLTPELGTGPHRVLLEELWGEGVAGPMTPTRPCTAGAGGSGGRVGQSHASG